MGLYVYMYVCIYFIFANKCAEGNLKDNAFSGVHSFLSLSVKCELCLQFV